MPGKDGAPGQQGVSGTPGKDGVGDLTTVPEFAAIYTFTPTAGQTTVAVPGGYTVGSVELFRGQTYLVRPTDYQQTDGQNITFPNGAVATQHTLYIQRPKNGSGEILTDVFGAKFINYRLRISNVEEAGAVAGMSDATAPANEAVRKLLNGAAGGTLFFPNAYDRLTNLDAVIPAGKGLYAQGIGPMSGLNFKGSAITRAMRLRCDAYPSAAAAKDIAIRAVGCPNINNLLVARGCGIKKGLQLNNLHLEGTADAIPAKFLNITNPFACDFASVAIEGGHVGAYGPPLNGKLSIGVNVTSDLTGGLFTPDYVFTGFNVTRVNTGFFIRDPAQGGRRLRGRFWRSAHPGDRLLRRSHQHLEIRHRPEPDRAVQDRQRAHLHGPGVQSRGGWSDECELQAKRYDRL